MSRKNTDRPSNNQEKRIKSESTSNSMIYSIYNIHCWKKK